jgi:protein-S-isoprenylcysteine O-methyltransferase Ste14
MALRLARLLLTRPGPLLLALWAAPGARRRDVVIPLVGLTGWTMIEAIAEDSAANRAAVGSAMDRGTRAAVLGTHLLSWWVPLLTAGSRRGGSARLWTGIGLLAAGALLRITAVRTLGSAFTAHVRVVAGQRVCRTGVYRLVRHPAYSGLFLLNIAPSVARSSVGGLLVVAVASTASTALRVAVEEQALLRELGAEYRAYQHITPRFVPSLGLRATARFR